MEKKARQKRREKKQARGYDRDKKKGAIRQVERSRNGFSCKQYRKFHLFWLFSDHVLMP